MKKNKSINFKNRVKASIKKMEQELGYKINFDIGKYLKTPRTQKHLDSLRGTELNNLIKKRAQLELKQGEDVALKDYLKLRRDAVRAQTKAQLYGSKREIKPPNEIKTNQGFNKYKKFIDKAQKKSYWTQEKNNFINNFFTNLESIGKDSYGYQLVQERFAKLNTNQKVSLLSKLVESEKNISVAYYFSSNSEMVRTRLDTLFNELGIPYNPNIDYTLPHGEGEVLDDWEDL